MSSEAAPITDPEAETEVLDDEPRSILLGLIGQLRKGMDLHRVALPTFVLEPRSMLERLTDFMSHPDILLEMVKAKESPEQRFLMALKYFLSGWHIRPKGVKKPYNPALSEFFRCQWKLPDGSDAYYIAEQVSHHPPISAYYYTIPSHKVQIAGELRPKSKFLGNSAASLMHGDTTITLLDHPGEVYIVTNPNIYARGLLFGTMLMELGDQCVMTCSKTGFSCEMEFLTKGFFGGTYNALKGKVKNANGDILYNLSGKWTDVIYIQKNTRNAPIETFFDVSASPVCLKMVYPEDKQEEYEARRLWSKVTAAMLARDLDTATTEKNLIEDRQRQIKKDMKTDHDLYSGRFFHATDEAQEKWKCELEDDFFKSQDPSKFKERVVEFMFTSPNPEVKLT